LFHPWLRRKDYRGQGLDLTGIAAPDAFRHFWKIVMGRVAGRAPTDKISNAVRDLLQPK
jgi:hypothetical protein